VYRFLARPRWIGFALLVILTILACLLLSRWQFHRLHAREAYNSVIHEHINQAPVSPSALLSVGKPLPKDALWRSVAVSGRYDADHVLLVRKRTVEGQPGFYVMTPIRGQIGIGLWVNRGWIAAAATATSEPEVPPTPAGTVTVVARMRADEDVRGRVSAADLPPRQIDRIVVPAISEHLGYPVYGGYGEVTSEFPATVPAPKPIPPPETDNGPHLSYAIQWVTFAIVAIVGWYVLIRKEAERLAEEREAGSGASGPDPVGVGPDVQQVEVSAEPRSTVGGSA
jgi:cytochrome oxidase assembly protein ShyY1